MDLGLHVFGRKLSGAKSETVKSEGILIAAAVVGVVLTACIEGAENKLPVEALFFLVVIDGNASAEVLNLNGFVEKTCDNYFVAEALTSLVNRV